MKFTINQKEFEGIFKRYKSIVPGAATRYYALGLYTEANANTGMVHFTGVRATSNNHLWVNFEKTANITLPGQTFLTMETLTRMNKVPASKTGEFTIELNERVIIEHSSGLRFFQDTVNTPDVIHEKPIIGEHYALAYHASEFNTALEMCSKTASDDETRYFMNGVLLEYNRDKKSTNFISTDGRRLSAVRDVTQNVHTEPSEDFGGKHSISPYKECEGILIHNIVHKLILSSIGELYTTVLIGNTHYSILLDDAVVTTKRGDGTFPNYNRVIPESQEHLIEFDNKKSVAAMKKLKPFFDATDRVYIRYVDGTYKFVVGETDDNIFITNAEIDAPIVTDGELPVEEHGIIMALNYNYLLQALEVATNEPTLVGFTASQKALTVYTGVMDSEIVIMPMQLT